MINNWRTEKKDIFINLDCKIFSEICPWTSTIGGQVTLDPYNDANKLMRKFYNGHINCTLNYIIMLIYNLYMWGQMTIKSSSIIQKCVYWLKILTPEQIWPPAKDNISNYSIWNAHILKASSPNSHHGHSMTEAVVYQMLSVIKTPKWYLYFSELILFNENIYFWWKKKQVGKIPEVQLMICQSWEIPEAT